MLADGSSSLIIVLNDPDPGLARHIAAKGHHVFAAFEADANSLSEIVQLARPRRDEMEACLWDMGFDQDEARKLANDSARSLTVLRRLIPAAPGRQPNWAMATPSRALLAALFAGGWSDENERDRAILELLAGQSYDRCAAELAPLAAAMDGPLRKSGAAWKLASPRDAWFLLASRLTNSDIERFVDAFSEVLGEIDPKLNLRGEEDTLALTQRIAPLCSKLLRRGLTETIILMSLYGARAANVNNPREQAEKAVADLLGNADERLWWSLRGDLQRLAEGAPEIFLEKLSDALARSPSPLRALFREDKDPVFRRKHLSDLLWALERLAWSVSLFARVCKVLANLADIDPGGRWRNRPANSLRSLFLLWLPQTNATLDERLCVLDLLRRRNPRASWALMVAITPKAYDNCHPTAHPQWRDFTVDHPETPAYLIGRVPKQF